VLLARDIRTLSTAANLYFLGRAVRDITLQRRIRELSAEATATNDADELVCILGELRDALRQQVEQVRNLVVAGYPFAPQSRRSPEP
jgi:hypothetical protein